MSYFKNIISQYYLRKGNQVIFSNKMNLTELAQEMSENLDFRFDPAALSRILNAKQLPTLRQIIVLSKILNLSSGDTDRLIRAAARDSLDRNQLPSAILQKKHVYTKFLEYIFNQEHFMISNSNSLPNIVGGRKNLRIIQRLIGRSDKPDDLLFYGQWEDNFSISWKIISQSVLFEKTL